MILTKRQRTQLNKIIVQVNKLLVQADNAEKLASRSRTNSISGATNGAGRTGAPRRRRSRESTLKMRAEIRAQRRSGVPVAVLAKKYGISKPYIYMMK